MSQPNRPEDHKPDLAHCEIGDWVMKGDTPWKQAGMQEFVPPGMSDDSLPWFFYPVYNGPNLLGWQRVE
ncbi:hypothetical protein [Haloferula sp. BvORR071]|uniref:hypothetical protein n=1 Tax=Haloferula sp. BvORR071 TaxID=1396141 RepID=UPI0005598AF9|nr:hypothetical protein [Haloferula sp. BvORR071]